MLSIPENIKELFRKDNRTKETERHLKLYFFEGKVNLLFPDDALFPSDELFPVDMNPYYVIDDSQIVSESMIITESLCESEDLKFGECNAAQFEITVADVFQDLTGMEFLATIEIGGYELALGTYKVESFVRQADRRKKKITAYNRMRNFQIDASQWYQGLNFPITLKDFRTSLCDYAGVTEINQSLPLDEMKISKTIEPEQISGLEILRAICEINGCFGQVDKTGRLKYVFLGRSGLFPSEKLFPEDNLFPADALDEGGELVSHYKQSETTYEDYVVEGIDRVRIRQEEGDIGETFPKDGAGKNAYTIQGNFLAYGKGPEELSEIAEAAYGKMSMKIYKPCHIASPALPWVEVGDILVCYTSDDVIETFCMKRTMSGCQAMTDTFESTGGKEREEDFGVQASIMQLEGKAAVIKKSVEEVSVRVTDLKNYTEAQFKITADQILAEVTRATKEEEKLSARITVEADRITSEVSRAKAEEKLLSTKITQTAEEIRLEATNTEKKLQSQITQNAESISLKVTKGDVTKQLNSELKITGNSIALTTGHFTINSNNMKVDSSGNVEITGKITAASGRIGNWTIDENGLVGDTGKNRGAQISGGHIEGATMDVADGILQVEDGYANSSPIVRIGGFACSDEYGRSIFQSEDEMTGMSGDPSQSGGLYLWAGYKGSGDYAFVVNNDDETRVRGSLHISGDLWLNGSKMTDPGTKPGSWRVGFNKDEEFNYDWVELTPSSWPNANDYPQYADAKYLWWYVNINYKDGSNSGPDS